MKMTRIMSLLLVLVMIVSCLASCNIGGGGNGGEGENNGDTNKPDKDNKPVTGGQGDKDEDKFGTEDTGEAWLDDIAYEQTNLIFQMTHCSNNEELPSGCERFLAGEKSESQFVDSLVQKRNENCYQATNVTVTYRYYDDVAATYGFSKCFDTIFSEVQNQTSNSADMYCNFMTDMLVTSLKGSFANLYSTKHGTGEYAGANHFNLKDKGYMADLMGSLTLSAEKVYVVASDYFIDLIRAFFIVPANVSLYNQIAADMIDDLNGDGDKNIDDIFEEVWAGDWTYDRLAEYSAKIYQDNDTTPGDSIMDTLGFGLGINGLPAAGLVYTSSVKVINKEYKSDIEAYEYGYPDDNEALYTLAKNIKEKLVEKTGITTVTSGDASTVGETTPLLSIRNRFTNNKMLFGGIILVGSLEYEAYQGMKDGGGFAVLPVPLYEKTYGDDSKQDMYLTQIHVVGRAGGISAKTTKFVQCSAFLQYQSSHSTDILNEYYDFNLTFDIANGVSGNVEMLKYIRENVRTSFDKLYEDAIGFLAPDGIELDERTRWHALICDSSYAVEDMRSLYDTYIDAKGESLTNLVGQYDSLPE